MFPLAEVSYIIESSFDLLLGGAGLLPRQTCRAHDRVALLFRLSLYIYIYNIDRYFLISIFHRREPWSILLEAMQSRCSGIPWPADVTRSGTQLRSFEKKKSPPVPMSSPAFHSRVFIGLAATGGRNITNGNGKVFYKKETWSASVYIHLRFPFMLFLLSVLEKKKKKGKAKQWKTRRRFTLPLRAPFLCNLWLYPPPFGGVLQFDAARRGASAMGLRQFRDGATQYYEEVGRKKKGNLLQRRRDFLSL